MYNNNKNLYNNKIVGHPRGGEANQRCESNKGIYIINIIK